MSQEMRTGGLFILDIEEELKKSLSQIYVAKDPIYVTTHDPESDVEYKSFAEPTVEIFLYDVTHAPEHQLTDRIKKTSREGDSFIVQDYPTPYWLWYYFILHARRFDDMKVLYHEFCKVIRPRGSLLVNEHKLRYEMVRHENRDERSTEMYRRVFVHKYLGYIFDGEIDVINRYRLSKSEIESN